MITSLNSAVQGLHRNRQRMAQHADRIARWGTQDPAGTPPDRMIDLQTELVGVMQARHGFAANLPVVRAADGMLGSLLDVLA